MSAAMSNETWAPGSLYEVIRQAVAIARDDPTVAIMFDRFKPIREEIQMYDEIIEGCPHTLVCDLREIYKQEEQAETVLQRISRDACSWLQANDSIAQDPRIREDITSCLISAVNNLDQELEDEQSETVELKRDTYGLAVRASGDPYYRSIDVQINARPFGDVVWCLGELAKEHDGVKIQLQRLRSENHDGNEGWFIEFTIEELPSEVSQTGRLELSQGFTADLAPDDGVPAEFMTMVRLNIGEFEAQKSATGISLAYPVSLYFEGRRFDDEVPEDDSDLGSTRSFSAEPERADDSAPEGSTAWADEQ